MWGLVDRESDDGGSLWCYFVDFCGQLSASVQIVRLLNKYVGFNLTLRIVAFFVISHLQTSSRPCILRRPQNYLSFSLYQNSES